MGVIAAGAVGLAFVLDLAVEEFPERIHPVAVYGRALAVFDRDWPHSRTVGVLVAGVLPFAAATLVAGITAIAEFFDPIAGALVAGLVLFATTSLRMLLSVASGTVAATETDLVAAKRRVRALAGRDPTTLEPEEVRSAAVESAAENLADGLVAPLLAFAVFSPWFPLAAGAAAWVKAVNTADSMLGYRSKPVGWAAARLDDAVMWLPARLSAVLIAIAAADPGAPWRARSWARAPASPNSGWPMATMATVLGVRFEKPGSYSIGIGELPNVDDAREGIRIVGVSGVLSFVAAGVIAWF